MFTKKECNTWEAKAYMAGDINIAKQEIREIAYQRGLCLTITPTTYIYTGGEETGFVIGMIQYPRFETKEKWLQGDLINISMQIAVKCCQKSFTIVTPDKTIYFQNKNHTK